MTPFSGQALPALLIKESKKFRLQKLEKELAESLQGVQDKEMIICPKCGYEPFSCRVRKDSRGFTIKCFACGMWRRI